MKGRAMGNVQNCDSNVDIPSSQTYRSYKECEMSNEYNNFVRDGNAYIILRLILRGNIYRNISLSVI
jgi:hypothetical protein